jgi:hypothetical protein
VLSRAKEKRTLLTFEHSRPMTFEDVQRSIESTVLMMTTIRAIEGNRAIEGKRRPSEGSFSFQQSV